MAILIKRYANRKLYNTESSRYITLRGISELVREGHDICVIDNESGEEITPIVLSQILVDDQKENRGADRDGAVSGTLLAELIQRGGDALYSLVRRGVGDVETNLNEMRDNVKRWIKTPGEVGARLDTSEIRETVHNAVERVLRVADLPTRGDLEALNKNLERLAAALESFEARLLEGRWRAELGDAAGAAQALGRLRDAVEIAELEGDRAASASSRALVGSESRPHLLAVRFT
jgi:polyhydroxyalkanoate synthesis repressor PhaR